MVPGGIVFNAGPGDARPWYPRKDGLSLPSNRRPMPLVGSSCSIHDHTTCLLNMPRNRHRTYCIHKCHAADGLQQEFARNGRTEEGSPVRANAVSVVRGGRNLHDQFESAEWRTAQSRCIVSRARQWRDTSGTYVPAGCINDEPAGGGGLPAVPCKRRAERSEARRAAWGSESHQFKQPTERRANG